MPSPVQVYTNLPNLFAFNKYNWSRTSLIKRRLVLVFNCMCLSYLGTYMLKFGSLLLGVLMGTQRHCPRHCQGSMPVPQIYNIEARWSWSIDPCVEEEMRLCSQAVFKSFLSGTSQESCVYMHWLSYTKDSGSMFPSLWIELDGLDFGEGFLARWGGGRLFCSISSSSVLWSSQTDKGTLASSVHSISVRYFLLRFWWFLEGCILRPVGAEGTCWGKLVMSQRKEDFL